MSDLKETQKIMRRNLIEVYRGWWFWHRLVKRYRLGHTRVVLLPGENYSYHFNALLYLDEMLSHHQYESAVILSIDTAAAKAASLFSKNILAVEQISRKQAERLMQFYCLYEFDPRFIIASLDEPNGRNAAGLIGKNGTTVAELIAIGVYQLPECLPKALPNYDGDDPAVTAFLQNGAQEYGSSIRYRPSRRQGNSHGTADPEQA